MIKVTANDFENLTTNSMKWGSDWSNQADRFEPTEDQEIVHLMWGWQYAHWTDTYMGAMFCRSYLDHIGVNCIIFFDTATQDYLILTDYAGSFASVS